jgi:OOP family OmpA-OmpF porin
MRPHRLLKCLSGVLAAAATLVSAGPSQAQTTQPSLALDHFDPAPAGDRFFGVQSPFAAGPLTPHVMILGDYAHKPLVLRTEKSGTDLGSIVSSQLVLHLNASLSLFNRLNLNIDAPLAVFQQGDSPMAAGQSFPSPSKVQFGDLRAGARLRIVGDYFDIFQLAVGGYVWIPTGPKNSYVSDGQVRGLPQLIVGGRHDRFVWTFAAGPEFRPKQTFVNVIQGGPIVDLGGGIGFLLGDSRHLQIGPEFSAQITTASVNKRTTNAEVLIDLRYRVIDDLEIGIGAGPGLTSGIGTPDFRGVAMIAYTPEQKKPVPPPPDRDHDGITDDKDACPDEAGIPSDDPTKNGCPIRDRDKDGIPDDKDACPAEPGVANEDPKKNGCPPPKDTDGDGIIDDLDACPTEKGVASDDPKKNGCPKDTDEDGIPDAKDACPDIKGVATSDPATNGCPPDTDGDTIRDDKDACPNEKGKPNEDPKKNGCPEAVRVTEQEIIILQQVQFDTNKATIKKVSDTLLDEVSGVLKEHPEITKIEVQGHTDNRGAPKLNEKLSQDRADAVRKALIKRGIEEGRLTAKGYGQNVPIADNKTEAGRQENRRVQFKITEKVPKQPKKQP